MKTRIKIIMLLVILSWLTVLPAIASDTVTVTGTVTDAQGEAVIGATVRDRENPAKGTVTDIEGNFTISVAKGGVLTVSYIGMEPWEGKVTSAGIHFDIVLKEVADLLDEIVVVGYGQQKKASLVGAITQTRGEVLEHSGGVSSVGAALTGNLPGVATISSTGMPGEEDPAIVIRGASSWNGSSPLILVDGIERPMSAVNISAVESISVLKDASATAVYGVKGANGVILITTKRGKEGAAQVDVNFNATAKIPSRLPGKRNSYATLALRNRVIEHELALAPESWHDYMPIDVLEKYRNPLTLEERERYPDVDWTDALFKDFAMSYNASINISGGTSFVRYFATVDYLNEGDLFRNWDGGRGYSSGFGYNRINGRSNLDFSLTKTTLFSVNLAGSYGERKIPWDFSDGDYGYWLSAYATPPDAMLPRYSDGTYGYYPKDENSAQNSAAAIAYGGNERRTTTRVNTDFTLSQKLDFITKGLSVKGLFSLDNTILEHYRGMNDLYNYPQLKWIDPETGETFYKRPNDSNTNFEYQEEKKWSTAGGEINNDETYRRIYYQMQLNWARTFGAHDITAMGLFSREKYTKGSEIPHYREDWAFRATYNYDQKYFLEFNGAYNGSEKFASDHRFDFFPSGAIGWRMSEEKFMAWSRGFLDSWKFRVSYGKIGDDNVAERWLYADQWTYENTAFLGSTAGETSPYTWYRLASLGNSDIHWETATKFNFGIDYSFLNSMFSGSIDFFRNIRSDILISGANRSVPSFTGYNAPWANLGKVRSTGFELTLDYNQRISRDWRIWTSFNMTRARDIVLERDNPQLLPWYQKNVGKPIGQAYSYIDKGFMNTWDDVYASTPQNTTDNQKLPGDLMIVDYNGDGLIDANDNVPYAYSGTPQFTFNSTIGLEWKGFSAFVQFYGVKNVSREITLLSFVQKLDIAYDQGTYWSPGNPDADTVLPRWNSTNEGMTNGTRYMYDGSYIRLKNAEIAYTFSGRVLKKMGIQNFRLYINGNNLLFWSHMPDDRESNSAGSGLASQGAYPTVRRVNLGFKITL